ncbi:MAG: TonB family protein [Culturomica sp.]|jgi:TonB family protein|nr:TonB family protein [Culturomica sp.]
METLFIYLLKVNAALLLFYIFYRLLFGKDTFFGLKRICLGSVLLLSFIHPLIDLSFLLTENRPIIRYVADFRAELEGVVVTAAPPASVSFDWESLLWTLYAAGAAFLLFRMAVQVVRICRLAAKGRRLFSLNTNILSPGEGVAPFSFLGWIFVNPEEYTLRELQEIVTHEKVHVRQGHSADMLISELVCVCCWFNPAAWLLRREIRQNLEFLADKDVVSSGFNRKNYQYHLLRLSHQSGAVPIATNFTVSQLKKRIVMMNKRRSSKIGLAKYLLLLPLTVCLVLAGNVRTWADNYPVENRSGSPEVMPAVVVSDEGEVAGKIITITGNVTDEKGNALAGTTVIIKGSGSGTQTDPSGKFSLDAPEDAVLVFSFVGKATLEVHHATEKQPLQVQMYTKSVLLETVTAAAENSYIHISKKGEITQIDTNRAMLNKEFFTVVEEMPRFKGEGGVMQYISSQVVYPKEAHEKGIQGMVFVHFMITASGKVTDARVLKSADPLLDAEALRVIREMPDWEPGKQRGKAVGVAYTMPVHFQLSKPHEEGNSTIFMYRLESDTKITSLEDVKKISKKMLIIIDGKESNEPALNKLLPETITSMTVLKDASALQKYGEKGKNGAVIIETQKKSDKE